ncbi:hypothetical protein [Macrococcoides canis]|uniref:hypothetical protein n=1 Tax=Macrococcoides canis TaxID=1855823 RepID=UPI001AEC5648|nr:hypothetical protein [Macrococcus canis]QTQ07775.1 hypothetical protein J9174_10305 [Macrococcus canis]QUR94966.1 hypothetical protein GOY09_08375 [Macrococcus canis]UTH06519.1 hypothetical protein KFV07_10280 [Macrococcus canis]
MNREHKYFIAFVLALALVNIVLFAMDNQWRGVVSWASMSAILLTAFILVIRRFMRNEDRGEGTVKVARK